MPPAAVLRRRWGGAGIPAPPRTCGADGPPGKWPLYATSVLHIDGFLCYNRLRSGGPEKARPPETAGWETPEGAAVPCCGEKAAPPAGAPLEGDWFPV